MKKDSANVKRIRDFLAALKKRLEVPPPGDDLVPLEQLALSILRADATAELALAGLAAVREEFVDFNEMRVAPLKDMYDVLPAALPRRREKAGRIIEALDRLFDHGNVLDLRHAEGLAKRELRAYLRETIGLDSYAEAYLMLHLFDVPAAPVDQKLLTKLKADEWVGPDATIDEARALLERAVTAKSAAASFELLAQYAAEPCRKKVAKTKTTKKVADAEKEANTTTKAADAEKEAKTAKTAKKTKKTTKTTKTKKTKKTAKPAGARTERGRAAAAE